MLTTRIEHRFEACSGNFLLIFFLLAFFFFFCASHAAGGDTSPTEDESSDEISDREPCPVYVELKDFKGFGVKGFNRADGFALSYGLALGGRYSETAPRLETQLFYYTDRSKIGWNLDFQKSFENLGYATVGITYRKITDTYDRWRMGDLESSLGSFVLKESFRNYFEREGISLSFTTELLDWYILKLDYTIEDHHSLESEDPFTLPGNSKSFKENHAIDEGRFGAVSTGITYDTRDNIRFPHSGWYNSCTVEVSRSWLGSDFSFVRWFFDLRRYHPVRTGHYVNGRLAFAGTTGESLKQRLLTAGGVGTLRGFRDESLAGDLLVLANIEYRFPIGLSKLKPILIVFNELHGMLFFDTGKVWFRGESEEADFLSDAGLGFSGANFLSYFGIYAAWPLNGGEKKPRFTIKIQRDF